MTAILIYPPRCAESSTTTGTGNFTLSGALSNFKTVTASIGGTGATRRFVYTIVGDVGQACAGEWETGWGYLSAASTMVRDSVFQSSNSGAAVNFSAGTKTVMIAATGLQSYGLPFLFGTGEDGDYAVPATTTVITQDKHWRDVTFATASTSLLNAAGYIIRAHKITMTNLTGTSAIFSTGVGGGTASGQQGGIGGTGYPRHAAGGLGGSCSYIGSTVGGGGNGQSGETFMGYGGRGGQGGVATAMARGGDGGAVGLYPRGGGTTAFLNPSKFAGGGGGGGGGSHTTTTSNAGGGGGSSPSGPVIFCYELVRASTNAAGTIQSTGGAGAAGQAGIGGSGGGGGGGFVGLCCGKRSGTPASSLLRSTGGAGNTAVTDSTGGYGGTVALLVLEAGTETIQGPTASAATTGGVTDLTV